MNVLGYVPTDLLSKSCYDFFHPEDQNHMKENFDQVLKQKGQMFSVMYRFRAKNREWVWLRTQAYAFLNPYNDEVEYIVCTNSSAKTLHNVAPENNGQLETEQPVYHQPAPGLDYTMQNRRETQPYNPHLMSHIAVPPQTSSQAPNSIQQRPNSAQNTVQYHYEPTPSPIQYGSPGRTPATMAKNSQNASPTPAWTMRQQQQPPESYQYSQLSPSRSPSGPTYTQLSSGINSRPAYNATATTQQAPHQPGYFGWSDGGAGPSSAPHNPSVPPGQHPQQGQELSDMLQMLGDQTGPTTFEDLNIHMFSGQFE
jgi:aryl hydrocarbon receptor nuclear translocator